MANHRSPQTFPNQPWKLARINSAIARFLDMAINLGKDRIEIEVGQLTCHLKFNFPGFGDSRRGV